MSWGWSALEQLIRKRNQQEFCERCKLLRDKEQINCSYCYGIDDHELKVLLSNRKESRIYLGKRMFKWALITFLFFASLKYLLVFEII